MANTKFHWHVDDVELNIKESMEKLIKKNLLNYVDESLPVHVYLDEYDHEHLNGFITDKQGKKLFKIMYAMAGRRLGTWMRIH